MKTTWIDGLRLAGSRRRIEERWAAHSRAGIRFLDLASAKIRLRIGGSGVTTVVFMCDAPNVIEHYDLLFESAPAGVRLVCLEAPGFGFSYPKLNYRFTFQEQAQVVAEALACLGMAPYLLAFSCVGAYTALRVAADRSDLVNRLCLIQAPSWEEEVKWVRRIDKAMIGVPVIGQLVMALAPGRVARSWYRSALPDMAPGSRFLEPALEAFNHGACFCLASFTQGWFHEPAPRFVPAGQPTLVLWGGSDKTHRTSDKKSIIEYAPNGIVEEFPDVGHFPELEAPRRFWQLLEARLLSGC